MPSLRKKSQKPWKLIPQILYMYICVLYVVTKYEKTPHIQSINYILHKQQYLEWCQIISNGGALHICLLTWMCNCNVVFRTVRRLIHACSLEIIWFVIWMCIIVWVWAEDRIMGLTSLCYLKSYHPSMIIRFTPTLNILPLVLSYTMWKDRHYMITCVFKIITYKHMSISQGMTIVGSAVHNTSIRWSVGGGVLTPSIARSGFWAPDKAQH